MTAISGINTSTSSWTDPVAKRSSGATPEFQAVLDKADSRAKSVTGTTDTADDTTRSLAQLDANFNVKLNQSQFDTGSASTIQAAGRLPPPQALFAHGSNDDVRTSESTTLSKLFKATDTDGDGSIDSNESDTLRQMIANATATMEPNSTGYSSTISASADNSGNAPVTTSDETITRSYDVNQLAQQVLRQYQQVASQNPYSDSSASGSSVDKVA
jgi:hypothetical protein